MSLKTVINNYQQFQMSAAISRIQGINQNIACNLTVVVKAKYLTDYSKPTIEKHRILMDSKSELLTDRSEGADAKIFQNTFYAMVKDGMKNLGAVGGQIRNPAAYFDIKMSASFELVDESFEHSSH